MLAGHMSRTDVRTIVLMFSFYLLLVGAAAQGNATSTCQAINTLGAMDKVSELHDAIPSVLGCLVITHAASEFDWNMAYNVNSGGPNLKR